MEEKKLLTKEESERLIACETAEEVVAFAKEMGDDFTLEQGAQLLEMIKQAKNAVATGELSDDDLDNVAGGSALQSLPWLNWLPILRF